MGLGMRLFCTVIKLGLNTWYDTEQPPIVPVHLCIFQNNFFLTYTVLLRLHATLPRRSLALFQTLKVGRWTKLRLHNHQFLFQKPMQVRQWNLYYTIGHDQTGSKVAKLATHKLRNSKKKRWIQNFLYPNVCMKHHD